MPRGRTASLRGPGPGRRARVSSILLSVLFLSRGQGFSCSQLCRARLACGKQGIDYITTVRAELVAMRFRNLVDQPMGTQQAQFPSDGRRLLTLFRLIL